jgi:hypothetical protein
MTREVEGRRFAAQVGRKGEKVEGDAARGALEGSRRARKLARQGAPGPALCFWISLRRLGGRPVVATDNTR